MTLPPNNELKACRDAIRMAVLEARAWGRQNEVPAEQLSDLMDAVHNIPGIIQNWGDSSISEIRREISTYDKKWGHSGAISLKSRFEQFASLSGE